MEDTMVSQDQVEHAIIPKNTGTIKAISMACAPGTGQLMQLQVNVPLKTPNQILHDIVIHNVTPVEVKNDLVEQK